MGTDLEPGLVARVAAGLRYALTGNPAGVWMGPMEPLAPVVAPEQAESAGVTGRITDYRVGYNTNTAPRHGEPVGFPALRLLADNFDTLRLVIETRKDQVCSLPWQVVPRNKKLKPDARCEAAEAFLRCPDQTNDWSTWLRMLLEDLYVLDAPAIYLRRTRGGELYAAEPIDGATIKPVIDATGRTPKEGPAYQQVLKGVPAVDYTRDELIYAPRNRRTHKVYGFGPVEQIINTVNIALRRQQFTLDYFTSGTVPDALAGVPAEWTPEQISLFQQYWDTLLMDDMAARRRLKFVPGEIARNFHEVKQPPLKDQFDEWLARIVCYCFAIDPTPFVAQVNRSVAETTREQSLSEGMAPTMQWAKLAVDRILAAGGWGELELAWKEGEIVDPVKRQQVLCAYVTAKILHPDEAREVLGRDPMTPEQLESIKPPAPVVAAGQAPDDDEPSKPGAKPAAGKDEPKDDAEKADRAIHIHNHITTPATEVQIEKSAPFDVVGSDAIASIAASFGAFVAKELPTPTVTVNMPGINIPAPVVEIGGPIINVEAPKPADVLVDVGAITLHAHIEQPEQQPKSPTETVVIERDSQGRATVMQTRPVTNG
jgi:hypothetical protein